MGKQKRKRKGGIQIGLFDQEMVKPVNIQKEPPTKMVVEEKTVEIGGKQVSYSEARIYGRPKVLLGSTKSCPICGKDIKLHPDGRMRCTKCWWWMGLSE